MDELHFRKMDSAFGPVNICCSDRGLRAIRLGTSRAERAANGGPKPNHPQAAAARWARQAELELRQYFNGERRSFTVPLDLQGTAFQQKVWKALCDIPYGQTRSYGEVARAVGQPKAARAVGMANHANSVPVIVPCHRVIAADGSLGGYAGGLRRKTQLLRLEQTPGH